MPQSFIFLFHLPIFFFPISGMVEKFYTIIFSLKVALSLQENQMWKFLYKKEKERGALANWTSEFFILISNQLDSTALNLNLPHFQIHYIPTNQTSQFLETKSSNECLLDFL